MKKKNHNCRHVTGCIIEKTPELATMDAEELSRFRKKLEGAKAYSLDKELNKDN